MAFLPGVLTAVSTDLPLLLALLKALGLAKNIPSDTATRIATVVADLEQIAADARHPSVNQIDDVLKLIEDLKIEGFISGSVVDGAVGNLTKFKQVALAYTSGQAALLDANFSFAGVAGDLVAVSKGGPAAQSLGL